jgi:hypothetical protein
MVKNPVNSTLYLQQFLKAAKRLYYLVTFTNIINKSLETGCMPVQLKEAMLKPNLKRSNLEFEEYSNFRPISNLKFLSEIIEKAVATQLMEQLVNNNLEEPLQSVKWTKQSPRTTAHDDSASPTLAYSEH